MNEHVKWPKTPRYFRDITITEKIDGTNGQIVIQEEALFDEMVDPKPLITLDGFVMWAGSRKRYVYSGNDNYGFAKWVLDNAAELTALGPGRHYGEWWGVGIQRAYGLNERRFSLFNTTKWYDNEVRPSCCDVVPVLYSGPHSMKKITQTIGWLQHLGSMAAPGFMRPEGICIFHTAANAIFKMTIENDEMPKGKV